MKETWTKDANQICTELGKLIHEQSQLMLFQKGQAQKKITALAVQDSKDGPLLLLRKDEEFTAPSNASLALYKPPGEPMRGFPAIPVLETDSRLGIILPTQIFWLQRRKHTRFNTSPRCKVVFTRKGSQYLNNGIITNISVQGAQLLGNFSEHIRQNDTLSPMTLTLRLRLGSYEEKVTVAEATIRRVNKLQDGKTELGVNFFLRDDEQLSLETFISLLDLESAA